MSSRTTRSKASSAKKKKEEEKKKIENEDEVDDVLNDLFDEGGDEESEGEDLYGSDIEKDYRKDALLDTYEVDGIDNEV